MEWNHTKNSELKLFPEHISTKSSRNVWWVCKNNPEHEWFASPNTRVYSGCPKCNKSKMEVLAFECLNTLFSEWNLSHPDKIKSFQIFDNKRGLFEAPNRRLEADIYVKLTSSASERNEEFIIELDGEQHFNKDCYFHVKNGNDSFEATQRRDLTKHALSIEKGIHMLRIPYKAFNLTKSRNDETNKTRMIRFLKRFIETILTKEKKPPQQISDYICSDLYEDYMKDLVTIMS